MKTKGIIILLFALLLTGCTSQNQSSDKEKIVKLHDLWALDTLYGNKIFKDSVEAMPYLEFHTDDFRFLGTTGCNNITGNFEADESTIKLKDISMTKIYCPGTVEMHFISAIKSVNRWIVQNAKLFLYKDDTCIMIFRRFD